jgi:hypothetical protein
MILPSIYARGARSGRSAGVGLIEILITLVVISAGLLAYVAMQRGIYREANLSSGRIAATEIALAKIEDLRSYTLLYTGASGTFAFQDIADNAGGRLSGGSLVLPSGSVTVDNIAFSRTWTVRNFWISGVNTGGTESTPPGNPIPTYKLVKVTVTWTEQAGANRPNEAASTQTLELSSIVAGIDPRFTGTIFR